MDFLVLVDNRMKSEKIKEYLDLAREQKKKLRNMRFKLIPTLVCALGTTTKSWEKRLEEFEIKDRLEYWEEFRSPVDHRRLAITQTPVKDHLLVPLWKMRKE